MIIRPFVQNETYTCGDYVLDPDMQIIFQVTSPDHGPDWDGPVTVDERTPARDGEHFILVKPDDLPTR